MGSLSGSCVPSRPIMGNIMRAIILLGVSLQSEDLVGAKRDTSRMIVQYLGDNYIVKGGCPYNDPVVLKWRDFCGHLHENKTLCVTERFGRNSLTIPRFSNICDALCHTEFNSNMNECPSKKDELPKPFSVEQFESSGSQASPKRLIMQYRDVCSAMCYQPGGKGLDRLMGFCQDEARVIG